MSKVKSLNLGISEFAEKAKLSRTGMYYLMHGVRTPDPRTLAAICEALGATADEAREHFTPTKRGRPEGKNRNQDENRTRMEQSTDVASPPDR